MRFKMKIYKYSLLFSTLTFIFGCALFQRQPTKLDLRLAKRAQTKNYTPDKYGVIIAATAEERHKQNILRMNI